MAEKWLISCLAAARASSPARKQHRSINGLAPNQTRERGSLLLREGDRQGSWEQRLGYRKIYLDTKNDCVSSLIGKLISNLGRFQPTEGRACTSAGKRMGEKAGGRQQIALRLLACLIIRVGTPKESKKGGKNNPPPSSFLDVPALVPIRTSLLPFADKICVREQVPS